MKPETIIALAAVLCSLIAASAALAAASAAMEAIYQLNRSQDSLASAMETLIARHDGKDTAE